MFGQLFFRECKQTVKSLIYWLIVLVLIFNFFTQLGNLQVMQKPEPGETDYGWMVSKDPHIIMENTLGALAEEYVRESYATYPIGFYKQVTLNEKDDARIGEILKETTGLSDRAAIEEKMTEWYTARMEKNAPGKETADANGTGEGMSNDDMYMEEMSFMQPFILQPKEDLTYERFESLMDEADDILGGGSSYGESYRGGNARVPMTYEDALEEYNTLIQKDRLTGAYARLFSDYMVIFLGILPVFLSVTRGLRDRRAGMQELIYSRRCSSATLVASRYLAMLVMLILPILMISMIPLVKCLEAAKTAGISADAFAFVKYTFGWLVPTIMIVLAIGMFLTELTDTALAILVQGGWWFVSIFMGVTTMQGGMYGWNLIPRHNTLSNWEGYHDAFMQLALNRMLYAVAAVLLLLCTALIFDQKRKGRLQIRGKKLANRKNKSKA